MTELPICPRCREDVLCFEEGIYRCLSCGWNSELTKRDTDAIKDIWQKVGNALRNILEDK
jgi:tRNA(Ile2) C34 agmatinyltransferase TiaS